MTREELHKLLDQAAEQIRTVTNASVGWDELIKGAADMRANEDAQIYQHLSEGFKKLLDPNTYPTISDPQGHRKTITIGGNTLELVVTHREPTLEKLKGVDVFYNLKGLKALGFQHKKRSRDGMFAFGPEERAQRDKIQQLCGLCKLPRRARHSTSLIRPYCASVYLIGDSEGPTRHVVSACLVEDYRAQFYHSSEQRPDAIGRPAEMDSVDRMFLQCLVGRSLKDRKEQIALESIQDAFLTHPDLLIKARLT